MHVSDRRGDGLRRHRWLVLGLAALVAATALGTAVPPAHGHLTFSDGTWTYKYWTRSDPGLCPTVNGTVDPLNLILYQYGEWSRMSDHLSVESHYEGSDLGGTQYVCGCYDSGNPCTVAEQQAHHKEGHGNPTPRSHYRMFPAPHPHGELVDKFTVIDAHYECDLNHNICEPWGTWEAHVLYDQDSCNAVDAHNEYANLYVFHGGQNSQGFFDDGAQSRLGGLHYGAYFNGPSGSCAS